MVNTEQPSVDSQTREGNQHIVIPHCDFHISIVENHQFTEEGKGEGRVQ